MKQYQKYLTVLGSVWLVCGILCTAFYFLYLGPLIAQMNLLDKKLKKAKEQHAYAHAATRDDVQKKLAHDLNNLQETIHTFVYPQDKIGQLPFVIGDIAKQFAIDKLNITNIPTRSHLQKKKTAYILTKQMDLQFSGSFHQIAGFLNALERTQPVMIVNTLNIARPRARQEKPSGNIELLFMIEAPSKKLNQ